LESGRKRVKKREYQEEEIGSDINSGGVCRKKLAFESQRTKTLQQAGKGITHKRGVKKKNRTENYKSTQGTEALEKGWIQKKRNIN